MSMFIDHSKENKYILGFYQGEHDLLTGVKGLKATGLNIHNVITPFPIHGLDDAMEMKRTRIPVLGFAVGMICGLLMLYFMLWVNTHDYPLNIGGKSQFSVPAMVPIWFEVSVLTGCIAMVAVFFYSCRLSPVGCNSNWNPIFDKDLTNDKLAVVFEASTEEDEKNIIEALENNGAKDITSKRIEA